MFVKLIVFKAVLRYTQAMASTVSGNTLILENGERINLSQIKKVSPHNNPNYITLDIIAANLGSTTYASILPAVTSGLTISGGGAGGSTVSVAAQTKIEKVSANEWYYASATVSTDTSTGAETLVSPWLRSNGAVINPLSTLSNVATAVTDLQIITLTASPTVIVNAFAFDDVDIYNNGASNIQVNITGYGNFTVPPGVTSPELGQSYFKEISITGVAGTFVQIQISRKGVNL